MPIQAGHLAGRAFWDAQLQTFAASLDVFERGGASGSPKAGEAFPPAWVRYGTCFAEFLTTDALANHLIAIGLAPDTESLGRLCRLGQQVAAGVGEPEFLGFTAPGLARHLFVRTPSGVLIGLHPRLAHPDHAPMWGDTSVATVATARLLCEVAWIRPPASDVEMFALSLTFEFLSSAPPDFSLSTVAVCDWFLTDADPGTTVGTDELAALRRRVGIGSRTLDGPMASERDNRLAFGGDRRS